MLKGAITVEAEDLLGIAAALEDARAKILAIQEISECVDVVRMSVKTAGETSDVHVWRTAE